MSAEKGMLRLLTCGSVDDGKSTLIGRMLYDCGILYDDQLTMLEKEHTGEGLPDFSCLLDGLLAEREQAITIDAAYRSFTTAKRRFLIADAPGHEQYTRNMVTAASHAEVALMLIDAERARDGLLSQTRRHTYIASLLGLSQIVFVVNKMDRCAYSQAVFDSIRSQCLSVFAACDFASMHFIPVSALKGENVCFSGDSMPWYHGPTLLHILESIEPEGKSVGPFCMPVQWVARDGQRRGLCGTILRGSIRPGQALLAQPSGACSHIQRIISYGGDREEGYADDAVCLELTDDVDIGRGEILCSPDAPLDVSDQFAARVVCFDEADLAMGKTYLFRQASAEAFATLTEVSSVVDVTSFVEQPAQRLCVNDIGTITLSLDKKIPAARYTDSRDLGGFLLVDRVSGKTVAAGMILAALQRSRNVFWYTFDLDKKALAEQKNQTPCVLWFTGLSASGKSTLADAVAKELYAQGKHVYILDGDNLRHGLNRDLGFSRQERSENIRRAGEVAKLMVDAGLIVLATFISPFREDRLAVRRLFEPGAFYEIFVDTPLDVCAERDPKGLYRQALSGDVADFTGFSSPFESPETPELHLNGTLPVGTLMGGVLSLIKRK